MTAPRTTSTESQATLSKDFGDADLKARLSFVPSARMSESVLEIHLELFGRVFEDMLQEAAISFPSRADIENDRPRLARVAPSGSIAPIRPRTFGRIGSPSLSPSLTSPPSRSPSPTSTIASSHTPSSGIRSTAVPHGFDTCVSGRPEGSHHDGPPKLELEEDQVARGREEAVPPPQASTSSSSSIDIPDWPSLSGGLSLIVSGSELASITVGMRLALSLTRYPRIKTHCRLLGISIQDTTSSIEVRC